MSTRWYPLYQQGNPQLRVFLPNFWLKLVKPEHNQPKNIVQFHCSMEMTRFDVKNYLEKIYDVHPVKVCIRIALGKTYKPETAVYKMDDVKIAYVTLAKTETFTFPEIVVSEEKDPEEEIESLKEKVTTLPVKYKSPGVPSWFGI